jgi:hypothetical protein
MPSADAQDDFLRARRRRALRRVSAALRGEISDVDVMLPFDEVVAALGRVSERDLGLQTIALDTIVGTVDRGREFDRQFRPTSARVRLRFERIAQAQRRGEGMPPIDVYRVGELHFVRDGHHRVAVSRAQGNDVIHARVIEVVTRVSADAQMALRDLPVKGHERLFSERIPLPPEARERVRPSDPWSYGALAEGVEAWGFRTMQAESDFLPREDVARRWYTEEYVPVCEMLREAGLIGPRENETDAFERLSGDRYRLMRTHEWSDEAIERLRRGR